MSLFDEVCQIYGLEINSLRGQDKKSKQEDEARTDFICRALAQGWKHKTIKEILDINDAIFTHYIQKISIGAYRANMTASHNDVGFMRNLKQLLQHICELYGISPELMTGTSRRSQLIMARRTFIHEAYLKQGYSLKQIGRSLNRHHTTILHHVRYLEEFQHEA